MLSPHAIKHDYAMRPCLFSDIKKLIVLNWVFCRETINVVLLAVIWLMFVYMSIAPFAHYEGGESSWVAEQMHRVVYMPVEL